MHCGDTLLFDPDLAGVNPSVQADPSATANLHLWIVLTEPQPPDFQCVIVNLTRKQPRSDNTVVLRPGDHPYITKDSVIRYGDALIVDTRGLDGFLKKRTAKGHDRCSPILIEANSRWRDCISLHPQKDCRFLQEESRLVTLEHF